MRIGGFLGRVVDLALYETDVLGSKPLPGGLSTNPRLMFVTFASVSVHSCHTYAHIEFVYVSLAPMELEWAF